MNTAARIALTAIAAAALTACGSAPKKTTAPPPPKPVSTAQSGQAILASASGSLVSGKLKIVPTADGVRLTGVVGGFAPNSVHAIHIHEKGDCSAVDASSAGGHFNPGMSAHGKVDSGTHHGGDMDNLVADGEGVAKVDAHARAVTLGGGAGNDVAGRAVVVHAAPDDYASQPAGNAGARIACGVISISH
ncbi:superoxide dismutase family protein [Lysobacter sp. 5GHs7-4]|uniref:superoxide dismutase family protein n=1 Tax=Lysobacter sp. 5GHs7-4 TaxID=2904253 RepID=UPI001E3A3BAE|nr:superoxide dismutase family protein [Lysobacter sp. 5GHs7-4]UHQ23576.1 superoxide dismutase family protein [Lysobacter sp. 5GHs7-4]